MTTTAPEAQRDGGAWPPTEGRREVLGPRIFWTVFCAAWSAYAGLVLAVILLEGEGPWVATIGMSAIVGPHLIPAIVLAALRRRILRPRGSIGRFIGHKVLVGVLYAGAVTGAGIAVLAMTPLQPFQELQDRPWLIVVNWFVTGLFLYTILLFFLMWLDALERVHGARALASEEAVLRARAEAKALRAQFNPHFVFNTLHSLMLLVRKEPDRAERAIEDVAGLIRYASTLQRREVDQVPLAEELAFARRYLSLEELRLGERLRIELAVDPSHEDILVPAFSLQTLLENAIKHGVSPSPEGGTVTVEARVEDGMLVLVVGDDGVGADPDAIGREGAGGGLQLLRQRLANVHGQRARLDWTCRAGAGFTATFHLPVRRVGDRVE